MHVDIGKKLVDLTDFISPELTVIDATRYLFRNGPVGGNLEDVKVHNKVIVSTDPTLADTYAAEMVGVDTIKIPNIVEAKKRKFGNWDTSNASISSVKV